MTDRQDGPDAPRRGLLRLRPSASAVVAVLVLGLALGFVFGSMLSRSRSTLYDQEAVTSIIDAVSPAVFEIVVTGRNVIPSRPSSGSGFLVDDLGHVVTNYHVIEGATGITVRLSDGRVLDAEPMGTSPADDLAVVRVDGLELEGIAPLALADSDEVRPGQMAIVVGSPYRRLGTVTVGVVSGKGQGPTSVLRRPIADMIQTDAALNFGNSGGPLLNDAGEVIGVATSVRVDPQAAAEYRVGFAVPSNVLRDLMPDLLKPQLVRRPWLGISGGSLTRDVSQTLGIEKGIAIGTVWNDSPAQEAGLTPFRSFSDSVFGDVITAVDGEVVGSMEDMVRHLNKLRPGGSVTLSVLRDGRSVDVDVTLAEWPDSPG